jgi:hypothetical protein
MPALSNPRRERFAQNIVRGAKNGYCYTDAYLRSGYKGTGRTAISGGSRLMTFADVQSRVAELQRPAIKKTEVSLASLITRIEAAIVAAQADKAHGAVATNHALILKIIEMVRHESEADTEFGGAQSSEQIAALMVDEMGVEGVRDLCLQLMAQAEKAAADRARPIEPTKPKSLRKR